MFQKGDLVSIVGEIPQYIYKVREISSTTCEIVGYTHRIIKNMEIDALCLATSASVLEADQLQKNFFNKATRSLKTRKGQKVLFGRVLHIDGDEDYLKSCLELYEEVGIFAEGIHLSEKDSEQLIEKLVLRVTPDIVVITGHDAYNGKDIKDLDNYENTRYFMQTVRKLRSHFTLDALVIIAGACSSHFEALIGAGANFASSPKRINSHTYDPAIVAIKVASTSIERLVNFENILKFIENGNQAIGGVETRGKMRLLL